MTDIKERVEEILNQVILNTDVKLSDPVSVNFFISEVERVHGQLIEELVIHNEECKTNTNQERVFR